jgi:hypothetical protein
MRPPAPTMGCSDGKNHSGTNAGSQRLSQDDTRPASLRTDPDQDCDRCPTVLVRDGARGMSWSEVVKVAAIAVALSAALAALYAFIAMKSGAPPP